MMNNLQTALLVLGIIIISCMLSFTLAYHLNDEMTNGSMVEVKSSTMKDGVYMTEISDTTRKVTRVVRTDAWHSPGSWVWMRYYEKKVGFDYACYEYRLK